MNKGVVGPQGGLETVGDEEEFVVGGRDEGCELVSGGGKEEGGIGLERWVGGREVGRVLKG